MIKKILLLFVAFQFILTATAQTTVPALVTSDQVWTAAGSPYLITQNTYIDNGVSVKVMPGTEVIGTVNNVRLIIDGEFQVLGNKDSLVRIRGLQMRFSEKSVDYDDSTGNGAYFRYAYLSGTGSGTRLIDVYRTDLKVDYCKFDSLYYGIYSVGSSDSNLLDISNSSFEGTYYSSYYQGYPIYLSGSTNKAKIVGCDIRNAYYCYIYGAILFHKNHVENLRAMNFYLYYGGGDIRCNTFVNIPQGMSISTYTSTATNKSIEFINNTLDTVGDGTNYPMLKFYSTSGVSKFKKVALNGNNFLHHPGPGYKLLMQGTNPSPTTADTLDFTGNYWVATTAADIESLIKDYADDITLFGRADISGFDSAMITTCNVTDPVKCGTAAFSVSVQNDVVSIHNDSKASGAYSLIWDFGDGKRDYSGTETPFHAYDSSGTYTICLYLLDANGDPCDSVCKDVTINIICKARFYLAIDTSNKFNLFIVNNSTGLTSTTQYYWDFGDGNSAHIKNPNHKYKKFGLYQICLTITDSITGCNNTHCDSIGMDSIGSLLKQEGFTISVMDENILLSVEEQDAAISSKVYPNPGSGSYFVHLNNYSGDKLSVEVLNGLGQIVYSDGDGETSGSVYKLNLQDVPDGIYWLRVHANGETATHKIVKLKH
ncbi:MAG: T9SS type A sorting domain-containing protein [Flavobacteriales bacterium]|nr:T9SS type A sorting domain-containing protein [Flavobacteriales bacterium]